MADEYLGLVIPDVLNRLAQSSQETRIGRGMGSTQRILRNAELARLAAASMSDRSEPSLAVKPGSDDRSKRSHNSMVMT